jgi:hypothetical protein
MAKRTDQNQKMLVKRLRDHPGVSVYSLAEISRAKGLPDLILGYRGLNVLIEVKGLKGKLNRTQQSWHLDWRGAPVVILRSPEEADKLIENIDAHYKHLGGVLAQTLTPEDA